MGEYDIIYADPAWRFKSNSEAKPGRNAMRHYRCMPIEEIKALPVPDWAAKDCLLSLWTTVPFEAQAHDVVKAWGFKYVSQRVWVKTRIATGFWARNRHELILIAKRGKFPCPKPAPFPDSVIFAPQREHSRKPPEHLNDIDRVWPHARKLEMFARQRRHGWDAWGDEVDKFEAEHGS